MISSIASNAAASPPSPFTEDSYQPMLAALRAHFSAVPATEPLFTTAVDGSKLWHTYLGTLPESERQHHNCHACRRFVETFGGLVLIGFDGGTTPIMWGEAPGIYGPAFKAVRWLVSRSPVTGVFMSSLPTWGTSSTPDAKRGTTWHHMHVVPSSQQVYLHPLKTADQAAAERREEYGMLTRGLAEFSHETIMQALSMAKSESLFRGEKVTGHLQWLAELSTVRTASKNTRHVENLMWKFVATAPVGFAHVKSSVVATLLEDIQAGMGLEDVKRRFAEKLDPLQYRRPTAAPSDGAIAQAEKVVASLQTAGALRRRYARLDEIEALWKPAAPASDALVAHARAVGVFGHLKQTRQAPRPPQIIKAPPITFEKFRRTVLPDAAKIEALVPAHGHFIAMITAADPSAPPIIQWDRHEQRNPVSWYVYPGGSPARQWGLRGGRWATVKAISLLPFMWNDGAADVGNQGAGAVFVLDGAKDERTDAGAALFPEILKSEYHAVRHVIERYSRGASLEGRDDASACGLDLRKGRSTPVTVRVTSKAGTVTEYTIDRWD